MPSYNHVVLIGNLTRDPELRYTPQGKAVCDFDIAINHQYKDSKGEKIEQVDFVPITIWAKQAELVVEFLKKGRQCLVEGRLKQEKWTNKEGQKRSRLKVNGIRVLFLGSPVKKDQQPSEKPSDAEQDPATDSKEDIPF